MKTICESCCEAGEYNRHGNISIKNDNPSMAQLAYESAAELHEKCVGYNSCLCQHRTGPMVQK